MNVGGKEFEKSPEPTEKRFLYKGINIESFSVYFGQDGITPLDPHQPWLTEDWQQAYFYAGRYHVFCFAIIEGLVVKRGGIKPCTQHSGYNGKRLFDYMGEEKISWSEIVRIFVTEEALSKIEDTHRQTRPPKISWDEFMKHVAVIKDLGNEFEKKLELLLNASEATPFR